MSSLRITDKQAQVYTVLPVDRALGYQTDTSLCVSEWSQCCRCAVLYKGDPSKHVCLTMDDTVVNADDWAYCHHCSTFFLDTQHYCGDEDQDVPSTTPGAKGGWVTEQMLAEVSKR